MSEQATAEARRLVAEAMGESVHPWGCPEHCHQQRLALLLDRREREALERALAVGCSYCSGMWASIGFNARPSPDTIRRWVHVKVDDEGYYAADCMRPEIHDMLRALIGEGGGSVDRAEAESK